MTQLQHAKNWEQLLHDDIFCNNNKTEGAVMAPSVLWLYHSPGIGPFYNGKATASRYSFFIISIKDDRLVLLSAL